MRRERRTSRGGRFETPRTHRGSAKIRYPKESLRRQETKTLLRICREVNGWLAKSVSATLRMKDAVGAVAESCRDLGHSVAGARP